MLGRLLGDEFKMKVDTLGRIDDWKVFWGVLTSYDPNMFYKVFIFKILIQIKYHNFSTSL